MTQLSPYLELAVLARFDVSPLLLAAVIQLIALAIRKNWL